MSSFGEFGPSNLAVVGAPKTFVDGNSVLASVIDISSEVPDGVTWVVLGWCLSVKSTFPSTHVWGSIFSAGGNNIQQQQIGPPIESGWSYMGATGLYLPFPPSTEVHIYGESDAGDVTFQAVAWGIELPYVAVTL